MVTNALFMGVEQQSIGAAMRIRHVAEIQIKHYCLGFLQSPCKKSFRIFLKPKTIQY